MLRAQGKLKVKHTIGVYSRVDLGRGVHFFSLHGGWCATYGVRLFVMAQHYLRLLLNEAGSYDQRDL